MSNVIVYDEKGIFFGALGPKLSESFSGVTLARSKAEFVEAIAAWAFDLAIVCSAHPSGVAHMLDGIPPGLLPPVVIAGEGHSFSGIFEAASGPVACVPAGVLASGGLEIAMSVISACARRFAGEGPAAKAAELAAALEASHAEVERLRSEVENRGSERELADMALRQSESLLKFIVDNIPLGVWLTDRKGRVILENSAAAAIWSGTRYENIGRGLDYCEAASAPEAASSGMSGAVVAIIAGKADHAGVEKLEFSGDGRKVVSYSILPIGDPSSGETIGAIVVSQDVTERRLAEDALRRSEQKYRQIIELSNEGFWVVGADGFTSFVSPRMAQILGVERSQLTGAPPRRFMDEANAAVFYRAAEACARGGRQYFEMEFAGGAGRRIFARVSMSPMNEPGTGYSGFVSLVSDLTETRLLEEQVERARKELLGRYTFHDIIGKSECMAELFETMQAAAEYDCNILIEGQSGTGKNLFARTIHALSPRNQAPFVVVNCGAIPETLLESELFGYMRGAFTDARRDKPGKFAQAAGGTIFLDEISEMPLLLQVKLLRFIEEKKYEPLGSLETVSADVRVIAATNRDLAKMVAAGGFREDLYYRLKVVRFRIPALSERREDIDALLDYFIDSFARKYGKKIVAVSPEVRRFMEMYEFPGNVRELQNMLESAFVFCGQTVIGAEHLQPEYRKLIAGMSGRTGLTTGDVALLQPLSAVSTDTEKAAITAALKVSDGNRGGAAAILGIERTTLWRKMKKYGLT